MLFLGGGVTRACVEVEVDEVDDVGSVGFNFFIPDDRSGGGGGGGGGLYTL